MTRYFVMTGGRDADEVMDRAGAHGAPVRAVAHLAPSGAVYGAVEIRTSKAEGRGVDGQTATPSVAPLTPVRDAHGTPAEAGAQAGDSSASSPNVSPGGAP